MNKNDDNNSINDDDDDDEQRDFILVNDSSLNYSNFNLKSFNVLVFLKLKEISQILNALLLTMNKYIRMIIYILLITAFIVGFIDLITIYFTLSLKLITFWL